LTPLSAGLQLQLEGADGAVFVGCSTKGMWQLFATP
jgi:hypothetical protein